MRSCGGCGGTWEAPARFCGRCGDPLTTEATALSDRRVGPWRVLAVTLLFAATVFAVLGVASAELRLPRFDRGDPAVSLPDAEEVPDAPALDPDERAAALAPFDPDRLTCEPAGCERWRRSVAQGWFGNVALDGDQVVVALDELVAIDLATGTDRWRVPFAAELRWEPDTGAGWAAAPPQVSVADGTIAVASDHGVQLVDRDGHPRWARAFAEGTSLETVLVVDDVAVLFQQQLGEAPWVEDDAVDETEPIDETEPRDEGGYPSTITVLDAADGRTRWQHEGHSHRGLLGDHGVAVAEGAEVRVLDLATGETRFTFDLAGDGWYWSGGDVVFVRDGQPQEHPPGDDPPPAAAARLLSAVDGRPIEGVRLLDVDTFQEQGDLLLVFARTRDPDADAEPGVAVVALEADGTVRWQLGLGPSGEGCCGSALDLGDGRLLVASGPTTERLVVDAATGRTLGHRAPWLPDVDDETGFYQHGPRVVAEHRYGGAGASLRLHDAEGRMLEVRGHAWPLLPRDGARDDDQPFLLISNRELVAVGFP
jgi:outer membrane protein assembly factor BamB